MTCRHFLFCFHPCQDSFFLVKSRRDRLPHHCRYAASSCNSQNLVGSRNTKFTSAHHFATLGAARSCEEANAHQYHIQHCRHAFTYRAAHALDLARGAAHALLVPNPHKSIHPRLTCACLVQQLGTSLYPVVACHSLTPYIVRIRIQGSGIMNVLLCAHIVILRMTTAKTR